MKRQWLTACLALSVAQSLWAYTAVFLDPGGFTQTQATAIAANGQIVGYGGDPINGGVYALMWPNYSSAPVVLGRGEAWATDGFNQGGSTVPNLQAVLWQGQNPSIDLTPEPVYVFPGPGYAHSRVSSMAGGQQVGSGSLVFRGSGEDRALLWTGSASSVVDLTPASAVRAVAWGTDGVHQAGQVDFPYLSATTTHAAMWSGTAESFIDLNPPGALGSTARAISNGRAVGVANFGDAISHAILWNGHAEDHLDLSPNFSARLWAIAGEYQAGWGEFAVDHAMVWRGTVDSKVDLHLLLPQGLVESEAFGVDVSGNVVGVAADSLGNHAVIWVVPEPSAGIVGVSLIFLRRNRRRVSVARGWLPGRNSRR